jgi:molybdate transport system regulatory protein
VRRKKQQTATASAAPKLRAKLWVERGGAASLTDDGADLLEQIQACGSLSGAARRLGFSYRRAWMLLDAMNRRWPSPLCTTAVGGVSGGGAQLTDLGGRVVRSYRDLQIQIEHLLERASASFRSAVSDRST